MLDAVSVAFSHGVEYEITEENPVKRVSKAKRPKDLPRANRPWSLQERLTILEKAPWKLRVPIAIGMFTGLREEDSLMLLKSAREGTWLTRQTNKTGEFVEIPVVADFAKILDEAPHHSAITISANSRGCPWTVDGFRTEFHKFKKKLEEDGAIEPGLTFHGLRHTVGTILRENGVSRDDIKIWLGQKTLAVVDHYSDRIDNKKRIEATVSQFTPLGKKNKGGKKTV